MLWTCALCSSTRWISFLLLPRQKMQSLQQRMNSGSKGKKSKDATFDMHAKKVLAEITSVIWPLTNFSSLFSGTRPHLPSPQDHALSSLDVSEASSVIPLLICVKFLYVRCSYVGTSRCSRMGLRVEAFMMLGRQAKEIRCKQHQCCSLVELTFKARRRKCCLHK